MQFLKAGARLLQLSLASDANGILNPCSVAAVHSNAVRESNPAEAPAPINIAGLEPAAPAFLWRTAPRRLKHKGKNGMPEIAS